MGVLFISPDSLLIRLADQPLEIQLFWRSLFQGIGLTLFTGFRYQLEWWKQVRQVGRAGWVVMIGLICGSTCFVLAIQHARVAHVLLLLNTTPVIAGVLSWLVLGEKINRLTWVLIGISIAGSTLIVIDSAAMGESGSSAFGLLMALGAALATAINFLGSRSRAPLDVTPVLVPACFLLSLGSGLLGGATLPPWENLRWLLLLGGICLPMAYIGIQSGPRYISAPETSMIMLLESVFGILLAWIFLHELPGKLGVLGGGLVLSGLLAKAWWEWRKSPPQLLTNHLS
jgi:drug/metabolite transporter (DMT)-like permease